MPWVHGTMLPGWLGAQTTTLIFLSICFISEMPPDHPGRIHHFLFFSSDTLHILVLHIHLLGPSMNLS